MRDFKPGDIVHVVPDEIDNEKSLDDFNTEAVVIRDVENGRLYVVMLNNVLHDSKVCGAKRAFAYAIDGSCVRATKREAIRAIVEKELAFGRGIVEQADRVMALLGEGPDVK